MRVSYLLLLSPEVLLNIKDIDTFILDQIPDMVEYFVEEKDALSKLGELLKVEFSESIVFANIDYQAVVITEVFCQILKNLSQAQLANLAVSWCDMCFDEQVNPFDVMGHLIELQSLILQNQNGYRLCSIII